MQMSFIASKVVHQDLLDQPKMDPKLHHQLEVVHRTMVLCIVARVTPTQYMRTLFLSK